MVEMTFQVQVVRHEMDADACVLLTKTLRKTGCYTQFSLSRPNDHNSVCSKSGDAPAFVLFNEVNKRKFFLLARALIRLKSIPRFRVPFL